MKRGSFERFPCSDSRSHTHCDGCLEMTLSVDKGARRERTRPTSWPGQSSRVGDPQRWKDTGVPIALAVCRRLEGGLQRRMAAGMLIGPLGSCSLYGDGLL